jgi:hypothetical protein
LELSGKLHALAALLPGKKNPVPIGYEAGWASEPVWTTWRGEKSCLYRDVNSYPSAVQNVSVVIPTALYYYVYVLYDSHNKQRVFA